MIISINQGVKAMIYDEVPEYVDGRGWYVNVWGPPHGPFGSRDEASEYLTLCNKVAAAGLACCCLARDRNQRRFGFRFSNLIERPDSV